MQNCKLLSLDTSTNSTGYALYVSGELREYNIIKCNNIKDTNKRINEMIKEIYKLMKEIEPQIVVTEMTVVTRNAQAQRNLTMILGAIYGYCIENGIFYYSFRPTEWRKLINNSANTSNEKLPRKREELKQWSINKVNELYKITDINDDISDAILIGASYVNEFTTLEE